MKIRQSKHDKLWSKMVRERDEFTCQYCGRAEPEWKIEAAHIEGRRIKALRLEPLNGLSLCFMCHRGSSEFSAHLTPEKFMKWFKKRYSLRWEFIKRLKRSKITEREAIKEFENLLNPQ